MTAASGMTPPEGCSIAWRPMSRRHVLFILALSLAFAGLNFASLNGEVLGLFHDDAIYAVVAKALEEGQGYRIISVPTAPVQTKYPFIYSSILAMVWKFNPSFPENILALKLVNVVAFWAILLLGYQLCRRSVDGETDTYFFVILLGSNPFVFSFTDYSLSDTLFVALTLLALVLLGCHGSAASTPTTVGAAAGVIALAYLTRTAGAALILAGLLHFIAGRRRSHLAVYLLAIAAGVSPWLAWQLVHSSGAAEPSLLSYYVSYEKSALARSDPLLAWRIVSGNLRYIVEAFDTLFLMTVVPGLRLVIYPLIAMGGYHTIRGHTVFFTSFVVIYGALILSWPFHPGRYVLPLIPIVVLFLVRGVREVGLWMARHARSTGGKRRVAALARIPLLVLVALSLFWLGLYLRPAPGTTRGWLGQRFSYRWDGFKETFAWIRANTREDAILASAYDPLYYLYTGRQAIRPWFHRPETYYYPYGRSAATLGSPEAAMAEISLLGVGYVLIDPLDGYGEKEAATEFFHKLVLAAPDRELVFVSADGRHRVYRLRGTGDDQSR